MATRRARDETPMTLGQAARARVRLIVWCKSCRHEARPDPAELASRYGGAMTVIDWAARLACSRCGARAADFVLTGYRPPT